MRDRGTGSRSVTLAIKWRDSCTLSGTRRQPGKQPPTQQVNRLLLAAVRTRTYMAELRFAFDARLSAASGADRRRHVDVGREIGVVPSYR